MPTKRNKVVVHIFGYAGVGKTALAFAFESFLKQHAIECKIVDDNGNGIVDENPNFMRTVWPLKLRALSDRETVVEISTQLLRRGPKKA